MVDKIASLADSDDFIKILQNEIHKLNDGIIAIVYEDIKYFKYFNDTYGYKRGDKLLLRMATLSTHNENRAGSKLFILSWSWIYCSGMWYLRRRWSNSSGGMFPVWRYRSGLCYTGIR